MTSPLGSFQNGIIKPTISLQSPQSTAPSNPSQQISSPSFVFSFNRRETSLDQLPSSEDLFFTAPEGTYLLRDNVDFGNGSFTLASASNSSQGSNYNSSTSGPSRTSVTVPPPIIPGAQNVGTHVTLVTVRSTESNSQQTTTEKLKDSLNASSSTNTNLVFVEIPVSGESSGPQEKGNITKSLQQTKKSKPNITKSPSSFLNRIVANEDLAKMLAQRVAETSYMFFNVGNSFMWADFLWNPLAPLLITWFKDAIVTCHDVNLLTRETTSTIIGFNTGDILYYSVIAGKHTRMNKCGNIIKSPVTFVKWIPGSESLFFAGFQDGSILILDKDLEDQNFTIPNTKESAFLISKPPKNSRLNPQAYWKAATKAITCIAFSPDCQHVAVTSLDGTLRIVDYMNDRSIDLYPSFFGAFYCTAWSPDGKFILAGGQDDLISVYLFHGRLVLRCQGHTSWVTNVSFDPYLCTDKTYRFGSVGEDAKLCLWDFSISSLRRPKALGGGTIPRMRSRILDPERKSEHIHGTHGHEDMTVVHDVMPLSKVTIIEPLTCKRIHDQPLTSIAFHETGIVTADRIGLVRLWSRPCSPN